MIKFGMIKQLHTGNEISKEKMLDHPVKGDTWCKPVGGLWTSTLIGDAWSDWCRWTKSERFKYKENGDACVLTVAPTAKVFEINGPDDAKWLKNRYPGRDFGSPVDFLRLNWEVLAKDFDGIHLTDLGNSLLHLPRDFGVCMNAWDTESTVWFNWVFTDVKKIQIKDPNNE